MSQTNQQYDQVINECLSIFLKKNKDYGTSWRVLRPISIADQIYIKAKRIRTIQEGITQMVVDNVQDELKGIINYAIIGLMQLHFGSSEIEAVAEPQVELLYRQMAQTAKDLMQNKNNDYGEAWREMSQQSFVDLILQKLYRMKQIIKNDGITLMSEGLDANYMDILNYAAFALILY